jgi:hypothetical protein
MRKIKFIRDYEFANNGFEMDLYVEGEIYEVSDSCADSAIQSGAAEEAGEASPAPAKAKAAKTKAAKDDKKGQE